MKAMLTGFAVMIIVSVGAYFGLQEAGFSAAERNAGPSVRLE